MATLPSRTANTNPANTVEVYGTDGVTDWRITIANLLKNPGAIGGGTPAAGTFTTLAVTDAAPLVKLTDTTAGSATTQTGVVEFWHTSAKTGFIGFPSTGSTELRIATLETGGDIVLQPGGSDVLRVATTGISITGTASVSSTLTVGGILSVDDVTDTTSGITGSIHTDGGLGVAKKLFVADNATFAGQILGSASTTARATLNMPVGTAPSSPVNGETWFVGNDMLRRIGGVTKSITFA